ncbi:DUF2304 domain-containing protein [Candidatus Woesearchaeota archaeon]|nr:DUF2304 domain-containing protein [Candidatus Woesearchaeota archaeon]
MLLWLQFMGLAFGIVMIYLTVLFFKRKDFNKTDLIMWIVVWLFFMFMTLYPSFLYGIMEQLSIKRTLDFINISLFAFFSIVIFYLYNVNRKNTRKLEEIVRKLALEKEEKK